MGELDDRVATPNLVGGGIEHEVAGTKLGRSLPAGSPQQRPQAGEQNNERERFGQVVVGPRVQTFGFVEVSVLGREHQDRCPVLALAQRPADLEAVDLRQHEVEHDRVVGDLAGIPERLLTVGGDIDGEPFGLEPGSERLRPSRPRPRLPECASALPYGSGGSSLGSGCSALPLGGEDPVTGEKGDQGRHRSGDDHVDRVGGVGAGRCAVNQPGPEQQPAAHVDRFHSLRGSRFIIIDDTCTASEEIHGHDAPGDRPRLPVRGEGHEDVGRTELHVAVGDERAHVNGGEGHGETAEPSMQRQQPFGDGAPCMTFVDRARPQMTDRPVSTRATMPPDRATYHQRLSLARSVFMLRTFRIRRFAGRCRRR